MSTSTFNSCIDNTYLLLRKCHFEFLIKYFNGNFGCATFTSVNNLNISSVTGDQRTSVLLLLLPLQTYNHSCNYTKSNIIFMLQLVCLDAVI